MHIYSFYVGTTDTHYAHGPVPTHAVGISTFGTGQYGTRAVWGIWEGDFEPTCIYTVELDDDTAAHALSHTLAVLTGNDAILVVRNATPADTGKVFNSPSQYRARRVESLEGNRTLDHNPAQYDTTLHTPASWGPGYRFERDIKGDYVAYLVSARPFAVSAV